MRVKVFAGAVVLLQKIRMAPYGFVQFADEILTINLSRTFPEYLTERRGIYIKQPFLYSPFDGKGFLLYVWPIGLSEV